MALAIAANLPPKMPVSILPADPLPEAERWSALGVGDNPLMALFAIFRISPAPSDPEVTFEKIPPSFL
jgi:hypothetical protein